MDPRQRAEAIGFCRKRSVVTEHGRKFERIASPAAAGKSRDRLPILKPSPRKIVSNYPVQTIFPRVEAE